MIKDKNFHEASIADDVFCDYNYYKTKTLLAKKDSDEQVLLAEDQAWMESNSDLDQEINANMVFMAKIEKVLSDLDESSSSAEETIAEKRIEKVNQQSKDLENQNNDLQDKYDVLINQVNTFEEKNNEFNEQMKVLNEKKADLLVQTEVLQDQLKIKHVVIDTHTECFENPSYFGKAKDLRPSLYDERVIGLWYTSMFFTHSNEALEIKKFKRARENKIEFAYVYGNLNASYVNEKINFSDDYFQEIINPDFEKIDSPFQQTSSLKPYVSTVILEKTIIDLEDEVVSLLEKEKENLAIIESLKSKGFESSENAISELENQSENDCQVVEKGCDQVENSKVFASGMFKLSVSQSVSPISMTKMSCASNSVERCSKHMTGNRALLTNFVEKFLGTVCFGNNDFVVIAGYGDVVIGSMTIKKFYYVEGLGHNLFSVGQFCDKGLEVAFRKSTCFVRTEDGVDLLTGDRSSKFYTIALNEVASNSSACLLAKVSSLQSWLWHQRLSHLNFATTNNLMKNNLVLGLPKMKFEKDHLCSACEQEKIHRKHHKSKTDFASNSHFIFFTWICVDRCALKVLKENEASEMIIYFIKKTQVNLQLEVQRVRTDNGTEFKNKTLAKFFDKAKGNISVFVGYSKESAAFRIYNKRTHKIHESVNVNFNEISEMASKQFSLEPDLSNLNETRKSSNLSVSQVLETSKKDLEDLFHNFYDEYFDSSKITKSSIMNVETSNVKIPSQEEEVFHESSESF
nr:retrovirus-related Pol polyprotein from transposon TNT 1-94 [Tanacetum cinerariifolium]